MSTRNLCVIRKVGLPLYIPVLLYKSGVLGGNHIRTCYPDGKLKASKVVYVSAFKRYTD